MERHYPFFIKQLLYVLSNNKYRTVKLLLLPAVFLPSLLSAQANYAPLINHPDSVQKFEKRDTTKKHFGRAAIFFGISEITPWAYDHYIAKKAYSDISFSRLGHNLDPRTFGFDQDPFETNQFGHPYHGSYFFNAMRTNGYSFWQSAPAAFAGSYIWETAGENNDPATNDFLNTGFGGVILGEMEYRFANKVIDNRATGFKRQVSEVAGFILDPLNGVNRIINGKWGRFARNSTELHDSAKITALFDIGLRRIGNFSSGSTGIYGRAQLLYGDPEEDYNTPFSNIRINAEVGKDDSAKVNIISVYGSLAGWEIKLTEKQVQLAIMSANYDFIRNQQFFYGGQSVKINLFSEYDLANNIKINTLFGFGAIILGAAPDKYFYHQRDYDYGTGVAYSGMAAISYADKLSFSINYHGGWLGTIDGNSSHFFLNSYTTELSYMFIKNLSIAAEPGVYTLYGYYNYYPDVLKRYNYSRLSVRYSVTL